MLYSVKENNMISREIVIKKLEEEMKLAKLIPLMIFGLATLGGKTDTKILGEIAPFLLLGVLFGTIIPLIINTTLGDKDEISLNKLILMEILDYDSEVIAIGSIVSGIIYGYMLIVNK